MMNFNPTNNNKQPRFNTYFNHDSPFVPSEIYLRVQSILLKWNLDELYAYVYKCMYPVFSPASIYLQQENSFHLSWCNPYNLGHGSTCIYVLHVNIFQGEQKLSERKDRQFQTNTYISTKQLIFELAHLFEISVFAFNFQFSV